MVGKWATFGGLEAASVDFAGSAIGAGVEEDHAVGARDRFHQLGGQLVDGDRAGDALGSTIAKGIVAAKRVPITDDQHRSASNNSPPRPRSSISSFRRPSACVEQLRHGSK